MKLTMQAKSREKMAYVVIWPMVWFSVSILIVPSPIKETQNHNLWMSYCEWLVIWTTYQMYCGNAQRLWCIFQSNEQLPTNPHQSCHNTWISAD
jgi:hypothetical protein